MSEKFRWAAEYSRGWSGRGWGWKKRERGWLYGRATVDGHPTARAPIRVKPTNDQWAGLSGAKSIQEQNPIERGSKPISDGIDEKDEEGWDFKKY